MKPVSIHKPKKIKPESCANTFVYKLTHAIFSRVISKLNFGKISGNKTERTIGQLIV